MAMLIRNGPITGRCTPAASAFVFSLIIFPRGGVNRPTLSLSLPPAILYMVKVSRLGHANRNPAALLASAWIVHAWDDTTRNDYVAHSIPRIHQPIDFRTLLADFVRMVTQLLIASINLFSGRHGDNNSVGAVHSVQMVRQLRRRSTLRYPNKERSVGRPPDPCSSYMPNPTGCTPSTADDGGAQAVDLASFFSLARGVHSTQGMQANHASAVDDCQALALVLVRHST